MSEQGLHVDADLFVVAVDVCPDLGFAAHSHSWAAYPAGGGHASGTMSLVCASSAARPILGSGPGPPYLAS